MSDQNYKRILAVDYGKKRIGLALSDPLLTFAYAYKTVQNDAKLFDELASVIKEKEVSKIILGLPLKESGESYDLTEEVRKFKETLEKKFGLEVILKDERYSSSIAKDMIIESVTKKKKRKDKGALDRNAAAVILQDYLNEI